MTPESSEGTRGPLVTFALFAYNQEQFIEQAVAGALSQTYSPLEVILSDDCSSDGTFKIMAECVSRYKGPHRVVLRCNDRNEGLGGHINQVMRIAEGELIVGAAGDDVSMPTRVSKLVEVWLRGERTAHSIYSNADVIDASGRYVRDAQFHAPCGDPLTQIGGFMDGVQGASHAWTREVFRVFGPILPDTICEDRVIPLRSMLLGGIAYCPEPLVKYRVHGGNISQHFAIDRDEVLPRTLAIHKRNLNIAENYVRDLATAMSDSSISGKWWIVPASKLANDMRDFLRDKVAFHSGSLNQRLRLIARYFLVRPAQAVRWIVIVLAPSLYLRRQERNLGARQ
jgi:glycosyltransferase involved in cell wall biosynthesis